MRRPSPRPRRAPLLPGSRAQLPLFRAPPASPWPGLHPLPARHGWSSFFPATKLPWPPSSAFAPPCVARLACSPAPVHARILFLPGARPHLHLPASALPKPSHGVVPPWCRVSLCQSPMAPSRLAFLVLALPQCPVPCTTPFLLQFVFFYSWPLFTSPSSTSPRPHPLQGQP
ncbi:uncharacterized protein LOC100383178 [Zea mays]|uniref:Uncharacterized protein n=1 Tax=Zea mays TaxID=4577 RepID=C0PDV6_MAIZE|nr:uncharacterized protein LOC100383178 [Zea mays]ACN33372.1 unknown [Zea mays]|eukprot:NP_001169314.1 uncharacterized protein LOC100383178 [Zea mays]